MLFTGGPPCQPGPWFRRSARRPAGGVQGVNTPRSRRADRPGPRRGDEQAPAGGADHHGDGIARAVGVGLPAGPHVLEPAAAVELDGHLRKLRRARAGGRLRPCPVPAARRWRTTGCRCPRRRFSGSACPQQSATTVSGPGRTSTLRSRHLAHRPPDLAQAKAGRYNRRQGPGNGKLWLETSWFSVTRTLCSPAGRMSSSAGCAAAVIGCAAAACEQTRNASVIVSWGAKRICAEV